MDGRKFIKNYIMPRVALLSYGLLSYGHKKLISYNKIHDEN